MGEKFKNKTAIITGGASGIGKATAVALAKEGANLVLATSTIIDRAKTLAMELQNQYGVGAIGVKCDVRNESDVEKMVGEAVSQFGNIDIAFNNAGVGPDGVTIPLAPLHEVAENDWKWVLDVDLTGVFFCIKHELRQMRKQQGGCIITTASTAGLKPMEGFGAYGPAKAGLIQLTKAAAVENVEIGIRCNVICPGPTLGTGMASRMFSEENGDMPLRFGKPEDIADVVLMLCSDAAAHITGNVISADGGLDIL